MLILDSGGLSRLSRRTKRSAALITALRREGIWPPVVATVVVAESTAGNPRIDVEVKRFLKTCDIQPVVSEHLARRAARLRAVARRGSAIDAIVIALAEPGSTVLTGDASDLDALAANADDLSVEII